MGLIVTELNELRKLLADYKDGKVSREDLDAYISIYNQSDKRVRNALKYASVLLKAKMKKEAKALLRGNIVGNTENVSDKLPLYDRTVDRGK